MIVDAVVRHWFHVLGMDDVAINGIGHQVKDKVVLFHVDDGLLASRDPEWLQQAFNVLVELFERVGLRTNSTKTKVMTCSPGFIRTHVSREACMRRTNHLGGSYRLQQRRRVSCPECNKDLAAGSLRSHLRSQHGLDLLPTPVVQQVPDPPEVTLRFPRSLEDTRVSCPIPGCTGSATTRYGMRRHFGFRHPDSILHIPEDGMPPPLRCPICHAAVTANAMRRGHRLSRVCMQTQNRRRQRLAIQHAIAAAEVSFTADGDTLESVNTFRHLGRPLSVTDTDWPALYRNLAKTRARWAQISRLLAREGANPFVSAMFYKAVVLSTLLYGAESWVITSSMWTAMNGFHNRATCRLAGMKPKRQDDGSWVYPPIDEARLVTVHNGVALLSPST